MKSPGFDGTLGETWPSWSPWRAQGSGCRTPSYSVSARAHSSGEPKWGWYSLSHPRNRQWIVTPVNYKWPEEVLTYEYYEWEWDLCNYDTVRLVLFNYQYYPDDNPMTLQAPRPPRPPRPPGPQGRRVAPVVWPRPMQRQGSAGAAAKDMPRLTSGPTSPEDFRRRKPAKMGIARRISPTETGDLTREKIHFTSKNGDSKEDFMGIQWGFNGDLMVINGDFTNKNGDCTGKWPSGYLT